MVDINIIDKYVVSAKDAKMVVVFIFFLGRKTKIEDFFVTSCVFLKIYRAPKTDCLEINQTIFAVGSGCKIDVSKVSTKKFLQTDEN